MTSALDKYNNLTQRFIAALIGVAGIVGLTIWSEWGYFAVFMFMCIMTQLEFYKLVGLDGMIPLKFWGTFIGILLFTTTFLVEKGLISNQAYFALSPVAAIAFFIKLYRKEEKPFTNIAFTFLGVVYVAIPFSLINLSSFVSGVFSYEIVVGILFLLWASDTGAYFAGTYFGKTKLFERVSPKKSWEGSIGGLITSIGMAFLISNYFTVLELWQWLVVAGIMVIAGTLGDLVESLFKRSIEIKDSGSSIPGHGGFLDRFDSLLLSAPFIITFLRML